MTAHRTSLRFQPAWSSRLFASTVAVAVLALGACTPTFNWRDVPIGKKGMVALLPCKADRATRAQPFGDESVDVDMAGCEAGGATFAVAHANAVDAMQAETWLRAWRSSIHSQLEGQKTREMPAVVSGAATTPAPWELQTLDGGAGTPVRIRWFAQRASTGVSLYQAMVLGRPSSEEAIETFFEGLRLP